MFGIGLPEMILILALALIVVGPDKLPELARSLAKGVLELKKTVSSLKENLADENPFDAVKPELEEAARSLKEKIGDPLSKEWQGILPDEGVNPPLKEEENDIIEADQISEKDKDSFAEMDLARADNPPEDAEPTESPEQDEAPSSEPEVKQDSEESKQSPA